MTSALPAAVSSPPLLVVDHLLGGMLERQGMSAQGVARLIATARGVQDLIARFAGGDDAALRAPSTSAAPADLDLGSFFEQLVPVRHEDVAPPARPNVSRSRSRSR